MNFYINVPLKMLIEYLDSVIKRKINPEIYVDVDAINSLPQDLLESVAVKLHENGLSSSLHAAYIDLNIGARDEEIRRISVKRVIDSIKLAIPFKPIMVVCHPGYFDYNYSFNHKIWLENAYRSISEIGEFSIKNGMRIALENVFERRPDNIFELLSRLPDKNFGFCFDIGHANLFTEIELVEWIRIFRNRLFEVHIHDNHGKFDEHLPIGEGNIPYDEIFQLIKKENPIYTLEPHRVEHLEKSISSFLREIHRA